MINIKEETAERLKVQGVSKDITFRLFSCGLINDQTAKKFLIIDEYERLSPDRGEKDHVKDRIADDFCVSPETVKKYLCKKIT